MSDAVPTEQDLLRKALLVPCETKQELHDWIFCYLGLDLPDAAVDEASTASPMDAIWTVYNAFRTRKYKLPEREQYKDLRELMAYASRDSFKTLGAAILEVVVLMHLGLSVAHMAAIERQAKKAQQYTKDFFNKEFLREYVTIQNETRIEITRYEHKETGVVIPPKEFAKLTAVEQNDYTRQWNYIAIIVCTLAGANSEHVPFMVVDEVDVIPNPKAYEEAKAIPSPWQGISPITLYISTRKFAFGLVQAELDAAEETGLQSLHWNLIDVTQACPPERHLPDEPRIPIYYADPQGQQRGKAISEAEFEDLPPDKREPYRRAEGYAGCLKNCKLFFACKGRLATHQTSTNHSQLLKDIDDTQAAFKKVSPGFANAQWLCRKPSEEGLIYPHFERDIHLITAAQMAEKITGDEYPDDFTKAQLIALMQERGLEFGSGLDHGHTHNFSVVTGAKDGHNCYIFDVQSAAGLELDHKIALMEATIKKWEPRIWPDTADPSSNKTIKRKGFKIQNWIKAKDSVLGGIEIVRAKVYPAVGDPQMYLLRGDDGCELLASRMSKYHWKLDAAGKPTNIPDETVAKDEGDDECDAMRYLVMNFFPVKGKVVAVQDTQQSSTSALAQPAHTPTQQNYLTHFIQQNLGVTGEEADEAVVTGTKVKEGNFFFDM